MTAQLKPAAKLAVITPSNSAELETPCRGILIQTAGAVAITDLAGNDITIPNLSAGMIHPIQAKKILATGTGAVGTIIGIW